MDYRPYDNALGRFNSIDALSELMPGINPYQFGFNNPVFWNDPSGLFPSKAATMEHIKKHGLQDAEVSYNRGRWEISSGEFSFWSSGGGDIRYQTLSGYTIVSGIIRGGRGSFWGEGYFEGYFNAKSSGEYGPWMGPDFSSFFKSLNSYWSGMIMWGGEMKRNFVGDRLPENGVLYGTTDMPWSTGAKVYDVKFPQKLSLFKGDSDLSSVLLQLGGTWLDYSKTTSNERTRDSLTDIYILIYYKNDVQMRAHGKKERDSMVNSPNGTNKWYRLK